MYPVCTGQDLPEKLARWWRWCLIAIGLQNVEWIFHTIAHVDAERLAQGVSTPVLTTHLTLTLIAYPIFAVVTTVFVVLAARARRLGSVGIAPVGIAGLACHGAAPWVVLVAKIEGARILFPLVLVFALWLILAALWPVKS